LKLPRLLLGLLILAALAGAVEATTAVTSGKYVQWGTGALTDVNEIAWTYPADGASVYSPVGFYHNLTCSNTFYTYTTTIWNSSGAVYYTGGLGGGIPPASCGSFAPNTNFTTNFNDPTLPPAGSAGYPYINLPVGKYIIQTYTVTGATNTYSPNLSFTVVNYVANTSSTGGKCLTPKGFGMSYVAALSWTHVLFNLTQMSGYLSNVNSSNVWTDPPIPIYTNESGMIIVNTTGTKAFTLWIGGFDVNTTYPKVALLPSHVETPTIGNFTQYHNIFWLSVENFSLASIDNSRCASHTLNILCQNYAPNTVNMKAGNLTSLFLATNEIPKFQDIVTYNNYYNATYNTTVRATETYMPFIDMDNITLLLPNNETVTDLVSVGLADYVGYFGEAYIILYQNLNGSNMKIWQEQVSALAVQNISITNNTYVQYVVYTPQETRVISWDLILAPTTKVISLTRPTFNPVPTPGWIGGDVNLGFTNSYAAGTVGVSYSSIKSDISTVNFTVSLRNVTGTFPLTSQYYPGIQAATVSYIVPDANATYQLDACVTILNGSQWCPTASGNLQWMVSNFSIYYDNLGVPPTGLYGASKDRIYTGLAMVGITAGAMLFSAASAGWGGVIVVAIIAVTKFIGWFREMTWPIWGVLFTMAVAYLFVENRRKLE
jgi:hypothetical protein